MNTDITGTSSSLQDENNKTDPVTGLPLWLLQHERMVESHFSELLVGNRSRGGCNYQVGLTNHFISALPPQPAETPEASARRWLIECERSKPDIEATCAVVAHLRDKKREHSPGIYPGSRAKVRALTRTINALDTAARAYCEALGLSGLPPELPLPHYLSPSQAKQAQAVLLELEQNQARLWPYLENRYPNERAELDWIALRLQQFRRALWVLKEGFEAYKPKDKPEQNKLLHALRMIYDLGLGKEDHLPYQGITLFLTQLESGPKDAVRIVLDSFDCRKGSRFDPLKYYWGEHEAADFQGPSPDEDFKLIGQAIDQLSSIGQSFVTTGALNYLLCHRLPLSAEWQQMRCKHEPYAMCPLVCRLDFAGKRSITPKDWPFKTD